MRVEVVIGTIAIDALPPGETADGLRVMIVQVVERQFCGARLDGNRLALGSSSAAAPRVEEGHSTASARLTDEIGRAVRWEIVR
jgi:hypothetical protein